MLLEQIKKLYSDPEAYKLEKVQTLWSGYGEVARYYLPRSKTTCIAKNIDLQQQGEHPKAWNSRFSHKRKLSSYHNEQAFYQNYAANTTEKCKVAQCAGTGANSNNLWLIMQDLDAIGFKLRHFILHESADKQLTQKNLTIAKLCINWLANFHGTFLNQNLEKVWPIGCYWHLETRPDEWREMPSCELKEAASLIDNALNRSPYQTLLHGDAKIANFCFNKQNSEVAAVDFQYTGKGIGVKDVVYFLGSCFDDNMLFKHADTLFSLYLRELTKVVKMRQLQIDVAELTHTYQYIYSIAWADFERFLMGWSPSHKKLGEYSANQTSVALTNLRKT